MTAISLESMRAMLTRSKVGQSPVARLSPEDYSPSLRTRMLVLQSTPFCNLECQYCYLPSRNLPNLMTIDVVRAAARRMVEDGLLGDELTIIWHAGEPLVAPISFYRESFAALREELGDVVRVRHAVQTNATLVNPDWCELFRAFDVDVGVSIDGPAPIHDAYRKTRGGKGTHRSVMRGIQLLKRHGIPFHVIAVITQRSVNEPDSIFRFFADLGVAELCLNFDEAEGTYCTSSLAGSEAAHQQFIDRMLSLVLESRGAMRIREFDQALRSIRQDGRQVLYDGRQYPENAQTLPFFITSVAWNGDFSTFSPELLGQKNNNYADFVFGNVLRESYLDSTRSTPFRKAHRAILAGVEICRTTCDYFRFCGGGAPGNKLFENGQFESGETLYCRSVVKRPFDAVLARLETDLAGAARKAVT